MDRGILNERTESNFLHISTNNSVTFKCVTAVGILTSEKKQKIIILATLKICIFILQYFHAISVIFFLAENVPCLGSPRHLGLKLYLMLRIHN